MALRVYSRFSSSKTARFRSSRTPLPFIRALGIRFYTPHADVAVVGGGIVGLATAREIQARFPDKKVLVLEKENDIALHQTSHNSGVIHAGMYYEPGSTMARCCVQGAKRMYEYCEKKRIPHERVGKLIVATTQEEVPVLHKLLERGNKNGVKDLEILDGKKVKELEPNVEVVAALHSPNTGIVDYGEVARVIAEDIKSANGVIKTGFEVCNFVLVMFNLRRMDQFTQKHFFLANIRWNFFVLGTFT